MVGEHRKEINLTQQEREAGISSQLLKSTKSFKCRICGFEFSLLSSRSIACQGCRRAVLGCRLVRCPKCDFEFSLDQTPIAIDGISSKLLSDYMSKILSDYFKDFGEKPTR
jgi:hypothetical protein